MKISVVTTTYNKKDMLVQCIESVQHSVFEPRKDIEWEHIIYDDASTDGTPALFVNHQWKNIIYIRSEMNKGTSHGQNKAIERSSGEYVFSLDHDDVIFQRTLYNFCELAEKNENIVWFYGDFVRADANLKYYIGGDYVGKKYTDRKELISILLADKDFLPNSIFFKKEVLVKIGMFDVEQTMQDIDIDLRFLFNGYMPVHDNFLSHIRRTHSTNASNGVDHLKYREKMKTKYAKEIKDQGIDSYA